MSLDPRQLYQTKSYADDTNYRYLENFNFEVSTISKDQQFGSTPLPTGSRLFRYDNSVGQGSANTVTPLDVCGEVFMPPKNTHWKANYPTGMARLLRSNRLSAGGRTVSYKRYFDDYSVKAMTATWMDTGVSGFASDKAYVVQTLPDVIARCILMSFSLTGPTGPAAVATIAGVHVKQVAQAGTIGPQATAGFLRMGGVNHDAAPVTVPSLAPRSVYSTWALNPADSSAWTSVTLPAEVGILSA